MNDTHVHPFWRRRDCTVVAVALGVVTIHAVGCVNIAPGVFPAVDPEESIRAVFDELELALETGNSGAAVPLFIDEYLDQGRTRDGVALWLNSLTDLQPTEVDVSNLRVSLSDTRAVVDFVMAMRRCDPVDAEAEAEPVCEELWQCRAADVERCGWLRVLESVDRTWRFSGDGSAWGIDLTLRATAAGLEVRGGVRDPGRALVSVTATWSGLSESFSMTPVAGDYWTVPRGTAVPATLYPGHPLPWALDLTLEDASNISQQTRSFASLMDHFTSELFPDGEVLPPFSFTWQGPETPIGGAEVEILSSNQILWRSRRTFSSSLNYAGPTLIAGERYDYRVVLYDLDGNSAAAEASLILLDAEEVPPEPTSIAPAIGMSAGGQDVTIVGTSFLAGVRVVFGIADCLNVIVSAEEITCTTPALQAGMYSVLVINPSGRVGMLESAFLVM